MKFFQRLGFRKSDELDMRIALIAVRSSWVVVMLALLAWSIYDFVTKATLTIPFSILTFGLIVFYATDLVMRKKYNSGYQE